jgi:hypothetical protein
MIRGRVSNIVERFTRNRDYMRLANLECVRGFGAKWKLLRRPSKHRLPNLTPLWANWNLGTYSSHSPAAIEKYKFQFKSLARATEMLNRLSLWKYPELFLAAQ